MKKTNLIILIVGLVIILAIAGGVSVWLIKQPKEKPAVTLPIEMPETITAAEEKILSRLLGINSNEIPGAYKEKVELFKEKLKNDCLNKKEEVKNFLIANNEENVLKEMKEITIAPDLVSPKITPEGKKVEFEINKQIIFECLNINKNEFRNCQSKLNGLEINTQNAENRVNEKADIRRLVQKYLEWEAVKQNDENICQKFNLFSNGLIIGDYEDYSEDVNNCVELTQLIKFVINIYIPTSNCENLCQRTDKVFESNNNCLTVCQVIKNNNIDKCDSFKDTISKATCKAIISFNPNYCNDITPRFIDIYRKGKLIKEDMIPICKRTMYMFNAIKQNKANLLSEAYKIEIFEGSGEIEYLDKLYFKNEISDKDFDEGYASYCNLKYSQ